MVACFYGYWILENDYKVPVKFMYRQIIDGENVVLGQAWSI